MEILAFGTLVEADATGRRDLSLVPLRSRAVHVSVLTLGASLHTVEAPDRDGHRAPISLSMPTAADYEDRARNAYLGATCGRYANRIAEAAFELDGVRHLLEPNDGRHHLHGGPDGFSRRIWDIAEATQGDDGGRVVLALHSPDREAGYPGALDATATYELHGHHLRITYEATTDAPTVVNLTNHAYWNLGGPERWEIPDSVRDHELRIPSSLVLPAGEDSLPLGPLTAVADTPLDLRHPTLVHDLLSAHPFGADHSYAVELDGPADLDGLHLAAELHHPLSGRTITVATDQPAVHLYTGNRLGPPFAARSGLCLETQRFPDAPNRPALGSAVLRPGEHYRATTSLTFGIR